MSQKRNTHSAGPEKHIEGATHKVPVSLHPLPKEPLVSIIIPSYNQGVFIKETIDSVLSQVYRPIEIIVVDGASTDNTVSILQSYQNCSSVKCISEPDHGVADAVNKGLALAQGEIIGVQSSDDFYLPNALSTIVSAFQEHQDVGFAYADIITVNQLGDEIHRTSFPPFTLEGFLCKQFYIPQPSAFFRRALLEALGGWDESYFVADTEFWLRMAFRTQALKVDSCIAKRRLHDAQRNQQYREIRDSYWRMVNDSPELAEAPAALRRSAKAGAHLHSIRYNPTKSHLLSTYHLWMAILYRPALWADLSKSSLLIPGYLQLRMLGSWLKQRIMPKLPKVLA